MQRSIRHPSNESYNTEIYSLTDKEKEILENGLSNIKTDDISVTGDVTVGGKIKINSAEDLVEANGKSIVSIIEDKQNFTNAVSTYADLSKIDTDDYDTGDKVLVLKDETHENQPSIYQFYRTETESGFKYMGVLAGAGVEKEDYNHSNEPLDGIKIGNKVYRILKLGTDANDNDIAIGSESSASGVETGSFGTGNSIAIGKKAIAKNIGSISIGDSAQALYEQCIAIGRETQSGLEPTRPGLFPFGCVAIGDKAIAASDNDKSEATAIGFHAMAQGPENVAVGAMANSGGNFNSMAVGAYSKVDYGYGTAVGNHAECSGVYSTTLGAFAFNPFKGGYSTDGKEGFGYLCCDTCIDGGYGYDGQARPHNITYVLKSPSNIFFRNENFVHTGNTFPYGNKTSLSDYTNGKTLQDYLDAKQNTLTFATNADIDGLFA